MFVFNEAIMRLCEKFSNSEQYVVEMIPKTVNFFNRQKWLKEKLSSLDDEKIVLFEDKDKILWSILDNNEEFWLPFEKAKFYLQQFAVRDGNMVIEEEIYNHDTHRYESRYYGLINQFLVAYSKSEDDVIENMDAYEGMNYIKLGVTYEKQARFDKNLTYTEIAQKIKYDCVFQNHRNEGESVFSYINEDHDQGNIDEIDAMFYYWFKKSHSTSYIRYFKLGLFLCGAFLLALGAYWNFQTTIMCDQINNVFIEIEKLNKIRNSD
jgi:hypothetical protein